MLVADIVNNLAGFMNGLHVNDAAINRISSAKPPFKPTKTIALCVHIEEYSDLRRLKDFKLYRNLKQLRYARQKFYEGVRGLGYSEIRYIQNPTKEKLETTFKLLENECVANEKKGELTFVIVHYGGHGFQDNMTYALTNTIERHNTAFPIESEIRKLSEMRNTFVVALLECGREKMALSEVKHGKSARRKSKFAVE